MFWIVLSLTLDQITKHLATLYLRFGEIKTFLGFFHFTYATNRGIAFGLFPGVKEAVIYLTLIITVIASLIPLVFKVSKLTEMFIGFIVGGALGNLVDRIRYGYVVDFLTFTYWPTIINVADIFITIGSIGIMIQMIIAESKAKNKGTIESTKDRREEKGIYERIYGRLRGHGEYGGTGRTGRNGGATAGASATGEDGYTGNKQGRRLAARQIRDGEDSRLDIKNVYSESDKEWRGSGEWNFEEAELQGEVWGYNYLDGTSETPDSRNST
ncbi:signal peptidase II [Fervidobacterium changbaicum]|uniref:Lipoprotein signal peptidase n=1 Tax=Fervidobacterium changbaicum TaxID=310769 RepID=A0ABX5QRI6_9BACT|nr:signal peptidase II [Fervidobacterium changbaicum]